MLIPHSSVLVAPQTTTPIHLDAPLLNHSNIPSEFVWPDNEKPCLQPPSLKIPPIDMKSFLSRDPQAVEAICAEVSEACKKHGFFLVVNHGVDKKLLERAHKLIDTFFCMELPEKQQLQRKLGEHCGYANSFIGRFSSKLPWKETLSFHYSNDKSTRTVEDYFLTSMGEDYREFG